MNEGSVAANENSTVGLLFWGGLALATIVALVGLGTLPLPWKQQAIFGGGLVVVAILLEWTSRARAVTMALVAVSLFSTFRYGYWRVTQTWDGVTSAGHLHQWDTVFVVMLLLAEFYAFATLALGYFQTLRPLRRPPLPLMGDPENWPTVDVFIPTYNEPLSVVRSTILGAQALDYPANKFRVFVLDDGRRKEFADFAAQVGAEYITRTNNTHAKAGNINHALGRTSGECVAIFDSDHIPTSSFLKTTLGWFQRDPQLGMVQTPHHFYSPDPFERNLGQFRKIPNEGELFHRLVQDGNDLWNASFFCGSCAVLRRRALDEIGGIAVETVTEDAHTALRMQRRRWNTAYINLPQAAGLATESLAAHIGQRVRWARGMTQILRMENPLFASGMTLSQRLCYFNATTHFLFAIPRLIFLVTPLVYLLLGRVNIYGYSLAVFAYALPHIVLSDMTNSRVQGRYRFSFWNEIYEAVLAPYILFPTLLALINPRLGKFNVTVKGGVVRRSFFDRRIALPFLLLLALNIAGLVMAERRWVTDPFHHDTVIMNAVWTVYNVVILSVATSVAWERKQRRRQVRVNVRVPLILVTPDGQRLAGVTTQVSGRGTMTRLSRALPLSRGSSVVLALQGTPPCEIHAQVASRSKRRINLCFPELSLAQEKYLVSLIYCRPEAWVGWQRQRPSDRPLRSLGHIVWLGVRGIGVVLVGFFSRRHPDDLEATESRGKQRVPAVAASFALAVALMLAPTPSRASDSSPTGANGNANPTQNNNARGAAPVLIFHDHYELGSIAGTNEVGMSGAGAAQNFFLDMPLTKIISRASLNLHYRAPLVGAHESWLDVWLNGTRVGSLPLLPGSEQTNVELPADLLTNQNTLTLQLQGNCAACKRARRAWVAIDPRSELALSGTRLPLPNDLALLPLPFFDPAFQHAWSLPVVFSGRPDFDELLAASTVASWFGVFSDFRGVRFPVSVGDLPHGNAVVLALRDSNLARELSLPPRPGSQIAIRDNPVDPYGKLLILAGDGTEQLVTAARSLVTRNNAQAHADAVSVKSVDESPRQKYEAPRWLASNQPAAIGTYTTNERLRLKGSGSINIYFRIPPDLLLEARDSVPLALKYSYAHVAEGEPAWLHVRLNNRDIDSIRLQPASSNVNAETVVRLPTGRFQPYTNLLTIDVDFGRGGATSTTGQFAAIHRDSTIDLSGLPHSVILPRLELFADSGYPFTAWPDLSRTAVILSEAPDAEEYETLLDMMGFFGAQTGLAATGVTITDEPRLDAVRDKDLILLGSTDSQALLTRWADAMPVNPTNDSIREMPWQMRMIHPEWPFRLTDRRKLDALLTARPPLDVLVEGLVSPFRPDRSVLAVVPRGSGSATAIAAMFTPALEKGPIYGGVAVAENGRFRSFLVGDFAYHAGHLDRFQQIEVFLLEHYFFIPVLIVPLGLIIAAWLRATTERVAARRLAYQKIGF